MTDDGPIVITDPAKIAGYRLLVLYHAMKLEAQGLRHSSGVSATATVKREFKLRGRRDRVIAQFEELLYARGVLFRCALCRCKASAERFGFHVCRYHVTHGEDAPSCPTCQHPPAPPAPVVCHG